MKESALHHPTQSMNFFWKRTGFGRGTFSPRVTHTFRLLRFVEKIHFSSEVTR